VRALRLVELEGAGQSLQDTVGDPAGVPAFEPRVVLDADPGQQGDLLRRGPDTQRLPP